MTARVKANATVVICVSLYKMARAKLVRTWTVTNQALLFTLVRRPEDQQWLHLYTSLRAYVYVPLCSLLLGGDLRYAVRNLNDRVTDLQYQLQAANQRGNGE